MNSPPSTSQTSSQDPDKSQQQPARKRKWDIALADEATDGQGTPAKKENADSLQSIGGPETKVQKLSPEDAQQQAAETAKKLTESLKNVSAKVTPRKTLLEKEIEINHCPPEVRALVCRGSTHDEIRQSTGVTVKLRGVYKAPGDTSSERALHLYLTSESQENLDKAEVHIKGLIDNYKPRRQEQAKSFHFNAKTIIGMEGCDPEFQVVSKILGPQGSFLEHIAKTCSVTVVLKGKGAGAAMDVPQFTEETNDPLHIWIQGESKQAITQAKNLAENLVSTIKKEYLAFSRSKIPGASTSQAVPQTVAPGYGSAQPYAYATQATNPYQAYYNYYQQYAAYGYNPYAYSGYTYPYSQVPGQTYYATPVTSSEAPQAAVNGSVPTQTSNGTSPVSPPPQSYAPPSSSSTSNPNSK